jgi:ABC-type amino acid transport substrate-binding protein
MNKRFLLFLLTALLLLVGTALTACGDDDDDDGGGGGTDSSEIDTLKPGTLLVGVDVPYPPFEQGRPPDYEGFEIDLMNEIANRLGLETEYKDTPFDTIFRDLSQDKFDVAIAGSTITPEREKVVDFGNPWFLTEKRHPDDR